MTLRRRLLALVLAVVFIAATGLSSPRPVRALLDALLLVVVVEGSFELYFLARRRLSTLTSLAGISLAWAALSAALSLTASTCPGATAHACSTRDVVYQTGVGALTPLVTAAVLFGALAVTRVVLAVYRRLRVMAALPTDVAPRSSETAATPAKTGSRPRPPRPGRTTPKGTRPPVRH